MKKRSNYLILIIFFCVCLLACIRDNCNNVVCQHSGVCVQGVCTCPTGYEGDNCEKEWTDKFDGKWQVADVNTGFTNTYEVNVVSYLKDTFLILGFVDTLDTVYCVRKSYYAFDILSKTLSDTTQKIASGTGTINKEYSSVTGLYSFSFGDSMVSTKFTWAR